MVGVVLVINLLKRHPNCRVLLHRSNNEGHSAVHTLLIAVLSLSLSLSLSHTHTHTHTHTVGVSLERDPFLVEERDLSKCQALESCLWEIQVIEIFTQIPSHCVCVCVQTLKSHYCPEVAVLVSDLLKSVEKKSEEPIGKYLDRDFDDVIHSQKRLLILAYYQLFYSLQMLSSAETKLTDNSEIPLNYQIPAVKWGCIQD